MVITLRVKDKYTHGEFKDLVYCWRKEHGNLKDFCQFYGFDEAGLKRASDPTNSNYDPEFEFKILEVKS